jgi:hypothetical protein
MVVRIGVDPMSRRLKTIVVLGFELCLAAAFCASFAYFVRESRDFLAGTDTQTSSVGASSGWGTDTGRSR